MLTILLGTVLLLVASVLLTLVLRVRGAVPFGLAVLTIASSIVVLGTLVVSAFDAYRAEPMLLFQAAVAIAAFVLWLVTTGSRPSWPLILRLPSRATLVRASREHRTIALMAVAACVAALVELLLVLTVAPNTWDGLMYHLSRVALWLQSESVFHMDGGTVWQTDHQANGEFIYGWTMLLSGGDVFVGMVQWIAAIACAAAVYWGARILRFARVEAVFAAAVFYTFPQIVTQATSTYIDLQAALFVAIFALFAYRGYRQRSRSDVLVAGLAMGVGIGIKATVIIAVPGLAVLAVVGLRRIKPDWRFIVVSLAVIALASAVLGSSRYIQNMTETGSPEGDAASGGVARTEPLLQSFEQIAWTFVDIPGLNGTLPDQVLREGTVRVFPDGTDPGPAYVSEDYVAFGPIGWLVLVPLVLWFAFARRSPLDRRLAAIAALLYVIVHATLVETYHWAPHTLVTGVLIASPLLAWTARVAWLRHLVALLALFTLSVILVQNARKPLWPTWSPGLDRAVQQGIPYEWGSNVANYDAMLPADARVLFIGPASNTWDYPVFGPSLNRYVYRLESNETPPASEVRNLVVAHDIDAIVWAGVVPPRGARVEDAGVIAANETDIQLLK